MEHQEHCETVEVPSRRWHEKGSYFLTGLRGEEEPQSDGFVSLGFVKQTIWFEKKISCSHVASRTVSVICARQSQAIVYVLSGGR